MSAETAVYAALGAAVGVTALVGNRIFPDLAEQGMPLPLIVFTRTATQSIQTIHDGLSVASRVTISASSWASTRLSAEQIADAMEVALRTVAISTNRFAHYDAETKAHAAVVDFEVWEL